MLGIIATSDRLPDSFMVASPLREAWYSFILLPPGPNCRGRYQEKGRIRLWFQSGQVSYSRGQWRKDLGKNS
jgi:hypothetical protein